MSHLTVDETMFTGSLYGKFRSYPQPFEFGTRTILKFKVILYRVQRRKLLTTLAPFDWDPHPVFVPDQPPMAPRRRGKADKDEEAFAFVDLT